MLIDRIKKYTADYPIPVCLISIFLLAIIEARLVVLIHKAHFKALVDAAYGVITGMPHWITYQNRLLGPWSVQFISQLTGLPFAKSFIIFGIASLILANFVSFYVFLNLTKNRSISLRYTLYFAFCFLAFQDTTWLYLWDFIDITVCFIFVYGIFRNWNTRFFIYLFIVSLLNRENAFFISLWLMIDAFKYTGKPLENIRTKILKIDYSKISVGVSLTLIGILYTKFVRYWLFVKSSLTDKGPGFGHTETGQYIMLRANIAKLFSFWHEKPINIFPAILFIGFIIYLFIKMRANQLLIKVTFLFLCMLASIFLFGCIDEPRVFFMLIPFILVLNLELNDKILHAHEV